MLDAGLEDSAREKLAQDVRNQIAADGVLKHENNWGLRKMAYEINQRNEADYRWFRFVAPRELLGQLDHNLKIVDGILRFRLFKVDSEAPVVAPPASGSVPAPARPDSDASAAPAAPAAAAESAVPAAEPAVATAVAPEDPPAAPAEEATAAEAAEPAPVEAPVDTPAEVPAEAPADAPAAAAEDAPAEAPAEE